MTVYNSKLPKKRTIVDCNPVAYDLSVSGTLL